MLARIVPPSVPTGRRAIARRRIGTRKCWRGCLPPACRLMRRTREATRRVIWRRRIQTAPSSRSSLRSAAAVNRCSFWKRRSPLHFAALNANEDVIAKLIAANADLDLCDTDGTTALSEAVLNRNERVFAMLIAAGAAPRAHKLTAGRSLVHLAATNPNVLVLKQVIALGGDPNAPDRHRRTPLHHAAERGSTQVIEALVSMGAAIDAADEWAMTTAHFAAGRSSTEVLRLVIELGADIDARDKSGRSPCEMAAARGCYDNVLLLINSGAQRVSATNLLRTIAAIPDDADGNGKKDEAMRFLIKRGASIRGIDDGGQTPLFRASPRAIAILFALGVDINCRDNNQATPAHIAAQIDGCSLMTLIAAGADLTAPQSGWFGTTHTVGQLSWLAFGGVLVPKFELPSFLDDAGQLFAAQQCALFRLRALEICIGLQSLELPALVTCEILFNVFAPIECTVPFHRIWEIVTKIKHKSN
jgi:ankyrin repeat protein